MNYENLAAILLIAISYYLFSTQFFKFSAEIEGRTVAFSSRLAAFLIIYLWFVLASAMKIPLSINWLVFLCILVTEVYIILYSDWMVAAALSLFYVILSLGINMIFRSITAIILNVSLDHFDSNPSYLKVYPILGGFITMAVLLFFLRRVHFSVQLKKMLTYRKSLSFYLWTEVCIYAFLIVLLFIFDHTDNSIGIKLWGIKSVVFSASMLNLVVIYALRVADLQYYMDKQQEISEKLIREKADINKMWQLAYTDMLTNCQNRHLLNKRLEEYAAYGTSITLAFLDVNGLKNVNDRYGHMEGDYYLISVCQVFNEAIKQYNIDLFRYGGDEFVLISNSLSEETMSKILSQANEDLKKGSGRYLRSISYGVVHGECSQYPKLLKAADTQMYQHKQQHYYVNRKTT